VRGFCNSVVAMAGLCFSTAAWSDIYAFVDANEVTHFSNVPTDEQYRLILRSPVVEAGATVNPTLLRRSARYDPVIEDAARAAQIDPSLLRALIVVESGFDERAVSRRGARGLMQLMPVTARRYGVKDAFDPAQNIRAGARYLRDLLDRFDNDLEIVLAAYNAGEEAVERHGRAIPPFAETRAYVPRVLGVYTSLRALVDGG
jgi:soluble lytic murein transglycosylase-like protein